MTDDSLLTAAEAAARLNRAKQTLAGMRVEGLGPKFEKYGARIYYRASDVESWRNSQTKVVKFPDEQVPRSRKRLHRDQPSQTTLTPAEPIETISLRGVSSERMEIWEPVDVSTLTVLTMVSKYDDVVLVTTGELAGNYGVVRELPKAIPDHWLVQIKGRLMPFGAVKQIMPESEEMLRTLAEAKFLSS